VAQIEQNRGAPEGPEQIKLGNEHAGKLLAGGFGGALLRFQSEREATISVFVLTGERGKEVRWPLWSDIDFSRKCVWVTAKTRLRINPKDKEQRKIPVPASLVETLRDDKAARPASASNDLALPASEGRPDEEL
jgi:integrase